MLLCLTGAGCEAVKTISLLLCPGWPLKREVGIATTLDKQASYLLERTQTDVVTATSLSLSLSLSLCIWLRIASQKLSLTVYRFPLQKNLERSRSTYSHYDVKYKPSAKPFDNRAQPSLRLVPFQNMQHASTRTEAKGRNTT